jgi:MYXO-CTERM domain-containing protein
MFRGATFVLVCLPLLAVAGLARADVAPPSACDGKEEGDECKAAGVENGECVPCTDTEGEEIPGCLACEEPDENENTRSGCSITPHPHHPSAPLLALLALALTTRRRRHQHL